MQSEHLQQIMSYYIEDAKHHLAAIEQYLLNLQSTIEDPESVNELFGAVRCGIIGGANMLPISNLHITSIHKTGFCLVDCFKVFQQQGSVKVDQKLQDLLMQVFYDLKALIDPLKEPSGLTNEKIQQVLSEVELTRKAFMEHLNWLVQRSHSMNNDSEMEMAQDATEADDIFSLEDLESVIDELSVDSV